MMSNSVHSYRETSSSTNPSVEIEVCEDQYGYKCQITVRRVENRYDAPDVVEELTVEIDRRGAKVMAAALNEVAASLHKRGA